MDEETKQKISDSLKAYYATNPVSYETKEKQAEAASGRTHTEEAKQKMSETRIGCSPSEETRQRMSEAQLRRFESEEARQKHSEALTGRTFDGINISRALIGHRAWGGMGGQTHTEEAKARMSESAFGHEVVEETRAKISRTLTGHVRSPESSRRASESMRERWKDPDYARSVLHYQKPNEPELQLQTVLDKYFPNDWKYVGDGQFILGGKNPDFTNVNGKKQVIEVFGVYWHDPILFCNRLSEEELIVHYKNYGFECLVFWEYDVWDEDEVVARVRAFYQKAAG